MKTGGSHPANDGMTGGERGPAVRNDGSLDGGMPRSNEWPTIVELRSRGQQDVSDAVNLQFNKAHERSNM